MISRGPGPRDPAIGEVYGFVLEHASPVSAVGVVTLGRAAVARVTVDRERGYTVDRIGPRSGLTDDEAVELALLAAKERFEVESVVSD